MTPLLQKSLPYISIALLAALILSFIFYPNVSGWLSAIVLFFSLGMALFFIAQKHLSQYKQGHNTRVQFVRNILLDILGFLLIIGAASYLGKSAGMYTSAYGIWIGMAVGMMVGFAGSMGARKLWAKMVTSRNANQDIG